MSITVTSGLGCGRRLLWSVFWTLVVAEGSTLDLQNNRTRSVEENRTSSTTELQPNLRTEAPTQGTSMTATGQYCSSMSPQTQTFISTDDSEDVVLVPVELFISLSLELSRLGLGPDRPRAQRSGPHQAVMSRRPVMSQSAG